MLPITFELTHLVAPCFVLADLSVWCWRVLAGPMRDRTFSILCYVVNPTHAFPFGCAGGCWWVISNPGRVEFFYVVCNLLLCSLTIAAMAIRQSARRRHDAFDYPKDAELLGVCSMPSQRGPSYLPRRKGPLRGVKKLSGRALTRAARSKPCRILMRNDAVGRPFPSAGLHAASPRVVRRRRISPARIHLLAAFVPEHARAINWGHH